MDVVNNALDNQFQLRVGDQLAHVDYRINGSSITLIHTEVPGALEGQGIGSKLARATLDFARRERLKVNVECPFIKSYIDRHPEYQSILTRN